MLNQSQRYANITQRPMMPYIYSNKAIITVTDTVIKYIDTHVGAPKNALNQMQITNSLQNCTSNCTLTRGRTDDHKILSP